MNKISWSVMAATLVLFGSASTVAQVAPNTLAPTPAPTTGTPAAAVPAQVPTAAPVTAAVPTSATPSPEALVANILRQGTQVRLTVVTPVNTKEHRVGKRVELQVADDIMVNNKIILAKGTPAFGELTFSKKSGSFGKSGKMAGRVLYIKNGNENIPITGNFDDRGKSGTGATVGVAVVAGVFSAFVKGKNAVLEAGTEITATVERDTNF